MVISIALFGFAASGIVLNLARNRLGRALRREIEICVLLFAVSAVISYLCVNALPLDYFKLSTDFWQFFYLIATFLLFSLPFFFSGLVSALAYAFQGERSGRIYFASMTGSAAGALLPIVLIPLIGSRSSILSAALLPVAVLIGLSVRNRVFFIVSVCVGASIAALFFVPSLGAINPSPYKLLSQYRRFPDTQVVDTTETIKGRFDRVTSPYIRFAPGLSLKYRGGMPAQEAIIRDGDAQLVLYDQGSIKTPSDSFADYTLSYTVYGLFPEADKALIVQRGGGLAAVCAMTAGIESVRLIEELPYLAEAVRNHYANSENSMEVIQVNPRNYLAESAERYDIIHIENWGSSLPGMESLFQEHLFTEEAFKAYLSHLTDDGMIMLSRKLLVPPADSLRLLASIRSALAAQGIAEPRRHVVVVRNWDSFAILTGRSPFSESQIEELRRFADERNFDLVFYNGISREELNRFHVLDEPYYYESTAAVLLGSRAGYLEAYPLNVIPQSDDRPFHNQYLRWSKLGRLMKDVGSRMFTLILSGEVIVVIVFALALIISFLLLFLPVILTAGRAPSMLLYFLAIGAGFMFVEMGFIKEMTFLFGDPVLALSFVLAAILLFSGAGGFISDRVKARHLKRILVSLSAMMLALAFLIYLLVQSMMRLPPAVRVVAALLVILPGSFLLGFPFPSILRLFVGDPGQRAYGWAANGTTSVLSSIAAVQIALGFGISRLFVAGGLAYLLALLALLRHSRRH